MSRASEQIIIPRSSRGSGDPWIWEPNRSRELPFPALILTFSNEIIILYSATFGATVPADLLTAYPSTDVAMYAARVGIIGCVCAPYAVYTLMARGLVYESSNVKYRIFFAIFWFIISLVVALVWPNFEAALQLMGSLMALLMFLFPGIALIVSYTTERLAISIFGAIMACLGAYLFCYTLISTIFISATG